MVRRRGLVIRSRFIFPRNPEPVVPQQIRPSPPSESGDTQSNERACKDKAKTVQGIRHDASIQDDNKRQPEHYNKDYHRPSGADQSNTGAANPANPARPIHAPSHVTKPLYGKPVAHARRLTGTSSPAHHAPKIE